MPRLAATQERNPCVWSCPQVNGLVGATKKDWIGLYRVGQSNRAVGKRYYNAHNVGGMIEWAASKGPPKPGQYEFRYFKTGGYSCVAGVSPVFTVLAAEAGDAEAKAQVHARDECAGTVCACDLLTPLPLCATAVQEAPPINCAIGSTPVPHGRWTHVAVTFDGCKLRVLVNGNEDGSCDVATYSPPDPVTSCLIGGGRVKCVPPCRLPCRG